MPSNGDTADVSRRDLGIHFQGHGISNVISWKTVIADEECFRKSFIEVDIYHRMGPLRLVYSFTLTFIFKVKDFHVMHLL